MYNLKPYSNIRQWYYRGSLKSCNYSCCYCPFSKHKKCGMAELKKDEEKLTDFVSVLLKKVDADMKKCAVQIVPYGEALVHKYYWRELARLSQCNFIEAAGAQTNLSFNIDEMADIYINNGGIIGKLKLWCSFHPQIVTTGQFLSQCRKLSEYGIEYCAGAAGEPSNLGQIQHLCEKLPDNVYFFINKLDGLKRNYTAEETESFIKIDEYFELELRHHKADTSRCTDSLFVEADGTVQRCNICKPLAADSGKACIRKECSCYLSYCNQSLPELVFFNPYPSFRIPHYPKAVFFDIDGTLASGGTVTDGTVKWLKRLSIHSSMYFVTSLPYSHAMKRAGKAKMLFSGGVFAYGGMCMIYAGKGSASGIMHDKVFPLEYSRLGFLKENARKYGYSVYVYGNNIYKITLSFNHCDKMLPAIKDRYIKSVAYKLGLLDKDGHKYNSNNNVNIIIEDTCIQITSAFAGKKEGIAYICSKMGYRADEIAVFGNSASDIPMLKEYQFSVAVNADEETKQAAKYVIDE